MSYFSTFIKILYHFHFWGWPRAFDQNFKENCPNIAHYLPENCKYSAWTGWEGELHFQFPPASMFIEYYSNDA